MSGTGAPEGATAAGPPGDDAEASGSRPGIADLPGRAARAAADGWERFWFTPATANTLALVRILYGLTLIGWTGSMLPSLRTFYLESPHGLLTPALARAGGWSLFTWFPGTASIHLGFAVLLVAAVCLTVGFFPTPAAAVAWVLIVSFEHRNPYLLNSGDFIVRDLALLLALCPSGTALSVDRWRKVGGERFWTSPSVPQWGLRLIQIQASLVYFFSFWDKSGLAWRNGSAVSTAWRLTDLQRFVVPASLQHDLWLSTLVGWGTLAVELSLAVLVWNRRWRWWALAGGVVLHLVIDATLLVGFFSWAMISALSSFVWPETSDRWVAWIRDRVVARRAPRTVSGGRTPAG